MCCGISSVCCRPAVGCHNLPASYRHQFSMVKNPAQSAAWGGDEPARHAVSANTVRPLMLTLVMCMRQQTLSRAPNRPCLAARRVFKTPRPRHRERCVIWNTEQVQGIQRYQSVQTRPSSCFFKCETTAKHRQHFLHLQPFLNQAATSYRGRVVDKGAGDTAGWWERIHVQTPTVHSSLHPGMRHRAAGSHTPAVMQQTWQNAATTAQGDHKQAQR
jgi:hypothetical protein